MCYFSVNVLQQLARCLQPHRKINSFSIPVCSDANGRLIRGGGAYFQLSLCSCDAAPVCLTGATLARWASTRCHCLSLLGSTGLLPPLGSFSVTVADKDASEKRNCFFKKGNKKSNHVPQQLERSDLLHIKVSAVTVWPGAPCAPWG